MRAGDFDKPAQFRRRATQAAHAGNVRGGFEDYCRRMVRYRPMPGRRDVEAGQLVDIADARIWVRPDETTRAIGAGFRVILGAREYAVLAVLPEQRGVNAIEIHVQSVMV